MMRVYRLIKIHSEEQGMALPMALLLVFIAAVMVTPVLMLNSTMLNIDAKIEETIRGHYAADAGINESIWSFSNNVTPVFPYILAQPLNGMTVTVSATSVNSSNNITYKLISIAQQNGETKGLIRSDVLIQFVPPLDYSGLLDNAITSKNTLVIEDTADPGIIGPIVYEGTYTFNRKVEYDQEPTHSDNITYWPNADLMKAYYWDQVAGAYVIPTPITGSVGPGYTSGNALIENNTTITLLDTVYIKGNLSLGNSVTVNLNGNTIFVEGSIGNGENSLTLHGTGCVIAVGNINLKNCLQTNPEDFVLILSIDGSFSANNNFQIYGSVAARDIYMKNNAFVVNGGTDEGLNFPGGGGTGSQGGSGTINTITHLNYAVN